MKQIYKLDIEVIAITKESYFKEMNTQQSYFKYILI